jgi:hypothetical protein
MKAHTNTKDAIKEMTKVFQKIYTIFLHVLLLPVQVAALSKA